MSERREWIRKLRDEVDTSQAGSCPVCLVNLDQLVERHRREVERLRGALMVIAGQEDSRFYDVEGGMGIALDAGEKMRRIARLALASKEEER